MAHERKDEDKDFLFRTRSIEIPVLGSTSTLPALALLIKLKKLFFRPCPVTAHEG